MEVAVALPVLLAAVLVLLSASFVAVSGREGNDDIDRWCGLTPHAHTCSFYLGMSSPRPADPMDSSEFFELSVKAARGRALKAQERLYALRPQCRKRPEQRAWVDCVKLYENAVLQLNRTLRWPPRPAPRRSGDDAQTWLSAALTDFDVCRRSFVLAGAPMRVISSLAKDNASELISNSLAVNKPMVADAAGDFPMTTSSPGWRRLLQAASTAKVKANIVVAQDGSGNFKTLKDAIDAASKMSWEGRLVIYVKAGVYNENVRITSSMTGITLIGDGKGKTVISGRNSVAQGYSLLTSATLSVFGDRFIARDMTFRNTYGLGSQAVALLVASDRSVVYRCSIEGYQDTLFVFSQRQFYRECDIYGTIDFIFGNAAAVIQKCNIYLRKPIRGQSNAITAQGRSDPNQNTGIVIQFSNIEPTVELLPHRHTVRSYLGRPWMEYSRTVYMQNFIDSLIHPDGWLPWNGSFALTTLYYAEFKNRGPGSRLSLRVKWPGFHVIVRPSQVRQFTVAHFITGRGWLPSAGVPFSPLFQDGI